MIAGLSLQAGALTWLATIVGLHTAYAQMIVPFAMAGAGMALVFAPSAAAVLSAVRAEQAGQASGAANAIRELGGVLGIAVLSTVLISVGTTHSHGSSVAPDISGYRVAFLTAALFALAAAGFSLTIHDGDAAETIVRRVRRGAPPRRTEIPMPEGSPA